MLRIRNLFRLSQVSRTICQSAARLNDDTTLKDISGSVSTKFQVFRNETGVIFDIEEERRRQEENIEEDYESFPSPYEGFNLERKFQERFNVTRIYLFSFSGGVNGVFEIDDLVEVLRSENARNLCVIKVPGDIKYVDYLCLVDGISYRHMIGMAHFVRKMYKLKRQTGDIIPKIEGEKDKNWMAMDLGNIALHIFSKKSREQYDLESLWCLGEEYEKRVKGVTSKENIYQKYFNAAAAGETPSQTDFINSSEK